MKSEFLVLVFLLILGCQNNDEFIYGKIYLSNVEVDDTVKSGQAFTVKIFGEFPTPGWVFHKIEVEESETGFTITPIAKIRKGIIVPQVLVPCSTSVELVAKTTAESLKVSVIGRDKKIEKTIKVTPE